MSWFVSEEFFVFFLVDTLVFLLVFRFVPYMCVPVCEAMRVCCSCVALCGGKNEWLHIAWNSRAWFCKTGPQYLFEGSPLLIQVLPVRRLLLALYFSNGFNGHKYDRPKNNKKKKPSLSSIELSVCILVFVSLYPHVCLFTLSVLLKATTAP